jgi:3-oxoacyl-[acyl-carrier protein] reductase
MNLGIAGRWALVCAASKGLGKACAEALVREGVNVVITARGEQTLNETAGQLRAINPEVTVIAVAGDISTPEGRAAALEAHEHFDILVNNAGGPPPGDFREWDREVWLKALDANMLTPIELIKATVDGMAKRGFGRIVNITSSAVKSPIESLGLSNGARSGLTGFVAGLSRQDSIASRNVTINNLQPGSFDTDRLRGNLLDAAREMGLTGDEFLDECRSEIPAKRFGSPEEFGALCAFVCSSHASYITGQNLLIDGGAVRSSQ